ncbi:MAG: ATP-dependent helicase [Lachnospiraceae bacterium]|nr:ATP-dependent helicase [Lachnospiraceae bacterium]
MNQNEQLNRGQSDAVMHTDGPCVVIAPPGSGKTKVLTLRIGALIKRHGVAPKHILVVTFTRSAAEQMRDRYLQNCGKQDTEVTFGTFHAVFLRILKESLQMGAKLDGYGMGQPLKILSEKEKKQILTTIVNQTNDRRARFPDLEQVSAYISKRKNRMEAEHAVAEAGNGMEAEHAAAEAGNDTDEEAAADEIWAEYCEACRELGGLDFEDITGLCGRLLRDGRNAGILAYWRDRYRYLLVDEFQDVSPIQFSILRLLAAPRNHLFMVGDEDQSIYGFRGSDTKLMLALHSYYPKIRTCYLTVNYRSGRKIVTAAKHLIMHNKLRYDKEITAGNAADGIVRIAVCTEKSAQMHTICEALRRLPENETAAVIVRTNAQAAETERFLGQAGIRIAAAHSRRTENLYVHPVAKDVLAYLTLAIGVSHTRNGAETAKAASAPTCMETARSTSAQENFEAMLRVINKPYRAVSRHAVIESGGSVEALVRFYEGNEKMRKTLLLFLEQMQCLACLPPFAALAYLCRGIGYERALPEETLRGGEARQEALAVLGALSREAKEMRDHKEWLRAAADGRILPMQAGEAVESPIRVITMHACKGLEFDHVVLPGLNEGVVPHKKAFLPEEIEEERRLLYVAMTRARKTLLMTCVHKQGDQKLQMSRFIRDLLKH